MSLEADYLTRLIPQAKTLLVQLLELSIQYPTTPVLADILCQAQERVMQELEKSHAALPEAALQLSLLGEAPPPEVSETGKQ